MTREEEIATLDASVKRLTDIRIQQEDAVLRAELLRVIESLRRVRDSRTANKPLRDPSL